MKELVCKLKAIEIDGNNDTQKCLREGVDDNEVIIIQDKSDDTINEQLPTKLNTVGAADEALPIKDIDRKTDANKEATTKDLESDNFDPDTQNPVEYKPSKRTSIVKSLGFEVFTYDVYKNENQAGFITDRPLLWTKAFHMYTQKNNIKCRWGTVNEKKGGKCSELK